MNCRIVENGLFPKIQDLLKPKFVEVRLHTDMQAAHPNFGFNKRIQELREHFLGKGNPGLPQYVVVSADDPKTPLATKFDGAKGDGPAFRKFFKQGLSAWPKPKPKPKAPSKVGG